MVLFHSIVTEGSKRLDQNINLGKAVTDELVSVHRTAFHTLGETLEAFAREDLKKAEQVVRSEAEFKLAVEGGRNRLVKILVAGRPERLDAFRLANEILTGYERIHILCRRIAEVISDADRPAAEAALPDFEPLSVASGMN